MSRLQKLSRYCWYALVLTIPFGIRTLMSGPAEFSEYTSVFLYASDILLVLFVLSSLPNIFNDIRALPGRRSLGIFLIFVALSLIGAPLFGVGFIAFKRLAALLLMILAGRKLLRDTRVWNTTLMLVSLLALFQATVAIAQFTGQGQIGLKMLGESPINVSDPGTAKITVEGAKLIRAYGTMPDPNILAGFLLVGLGALAYLFLKADKGLYIDAFDKTRSVQANARAYVSSPLLYARILCATAMFVVSLGLIFTFSRSGWASAALAMLVLLILAGRDSVRSAGRFLALLAIITGAAYYFFSPLILARTGLSSDEPSVSYRVEYAKIGVEEISAHPLLGVGVGNQVWVSEQEGRYAAHGMTRAWDRQPVHNLYLLIASEIGIAGALAFCLFLAIVMRRLIGEKSLEASLALALLVGLLFFGLFDHFLWNIQAGRLTLWLAIAFALAHSSSQERVAG